MSKYHDFWSILIGKGAPGFFFGYLTIGYICMAVMICIQAMNRDKNSTATPVDWSWKFFWVNNSIKFVVGFLLMFIFVRLAYEYMDPKWMLIVTIGLGFGFMYLATLAQNIGLWTTKKASDRIKEAIEASGGKG